MRISVCLFALAGAYLAGYMGAGREVVLAAAANAPKLHDARATVTSDEVIVFPDDSRHERIDPDTGAKKIRTRKSGDVIWHNVVRLNVVRLNSAEAAPVLTDPDNRTYRTLIVELQ